MADKEKMKTSKIGNGNEVPNTKHPEDDKQLIEDLEKTIKQLEKLKTQMEISGTKKS